MSNNKKTKTICISKETLKLNAIFLMSCIASFMFMMSFMTAHATSATNATGLVTTIIKILAVLIIALGLFTAIIGLVSFASAQSEGDGPAKHKAVGQMAGGVMLIVLSIILIAQAPTLAGYISTSI